MTERISATKHDINNLKETCQSTRTPLHVPKFCELWSRNSYERLTSFCPPPKFSHWGKLSALLHAQPAGKLWHVLRHSTNLV